MQNRSAVLTSLQNIEMQDRPMPEIGPDDVLLKVNSGDPPLFDQSSLPLVKAVEHAKIVDGAGEAKYVTVREPVAFGGGRGEKLHAAAAAYAAFLLAFSEGGAEKEKLIEMLDDADVKLNVAFEAAKKMEEGK